MKTRPKNFSFTVFPFLKTSDAVSIGDLTFRSTKDTNGLSPEQVVCIDEIASMLFLQDNYRIKSASYAVVPSIDLGRRSTIHVEYLMNVQAVVAYFYALPHHETDGLFLTSEHASMAVFTPNRVSEFLIHPDYHVDVAEPTSDLEVDDRKELDGYHGLYNFRHHFWVARGSRLYGPKPSLTLNISQDLSSDFRRLMGERVDFRLLNELLRKPETQTSLRIFTSIRWFNAANNEANDPAAAIVDLSIAFEALLKLPINEKTNRIVDAISLLLGRIPRLEIWAQQFYNARSQVVHEGHIKHVRFDPTNSKKANTRSEYFSLLSFGRQVFQLCLGTLLVGADLAEKASLEEKLVTNQERFEKICKILKKETINTSERLELIEPIVTDLKQYKYVYENGLRLETMIGATKLTAKALLINEDVISQQLKRDLERLTNANRTSDNLQVLEALKNLNDLLKDKSLVTKITYGYVFCDLIEIVWDYVFLHYFWTKEKLSVKDKESHNTNKKKNT